MSADFGRGRICSFACFHGNKTGFLGSFKYKAPCFSLSKSQRCESAACKIRAWSLGPTLQNESRHKQAGRENGISVAERADGERRGKKSGALWGLFPPSLAVRRQIIWSGGGEFTFSESLRLLGCPPPLLLKSHADCGAHAPTHACALARARIGSLKTFCYDGRIKTSQENVLLSTGRNGSSERNHLTVVDLTRSSVINAPSWRPGHIWTQNWSSFWWNGQIRE